MGCEASAELDRREDSEGFDAADTELTLELVCAAGAEGVEAAGLFEELGGYYADWVCGGAGAEEDGDELGVGEGGGTVHGEAFAGLHARGDCRSRAGWRGRVFAELGVGDRRMRRR